MIWLCILCLLGFVQGSENKDNSTEISIKLEPCSNVTLYKPTGKLKLNSNHSGLVCTWKILPKDNDTSINLLLEKLQLDKDDVVQITGNSSVADEETEELFDLFHAQEDAVLLITGQKEIIVHLNTSSAKTIRHFSAMYASQSCSFAIDDDVPSISQPIYAKGMTESVECDYNYNTQVGIKYAFDFHAFSMNKSSVTVENIQGGSRTFTGFDLPEDLLSDLNAKVTKFTVKMNPQYPNDTFILHKHDVYEKCCELFELSAVQEIKSPDPMPILHDSKIPMECRWYIKNENKGALHIQFESVTFQDSFDVLALVDGQYSKAVPFMEVTRFTEKSVLDTELQTSSSDLKILFKPTSFNSGFTARVSVSGSGRYLKDNGTLDGKPLTADVNGTMFLLEVPIGQNVVLNLATTSFGDSATLDIYEDFSKKSRRIASVRNDVWYPIISSTNRMMVKAINFNSGEFSGRFDGKLPDCTHMSADGISDNYILSANSNCSKVCGWVLPPVTSDEDLFLHFQYIELEKGDRIQILKLDKARTSVADIAYNVTMLPQFRLSPKDGAYINITRQTCPQGNDNKIILIAHSSYLPKCSKNYTLPELGSMKLTSPNYPNTYPLFMSCEIRVVRSSPNQILHASFEQLDLASDHCLKVTQIVAKPETDVYSGNVLPNDYVFSGDLMVQFDASSCNTSYSAQSYTTGTGFALNVRAVNCGGLSSVANATLTIPANTSLCIWKVTVPQNGTTSGSVNTLMYNIQVTNKLENYKLEVYDGPTIRSNQIVNNSIDGIWSRLNSLMFIYERVDSSKPSSEVKIIYTTKSCSSSMLCKNGNCMHPDWKCDNVNQCGDYSDEQDCSTVPVPTAAPAKDVQSGISPTTFGICSIVFIILGAALVVFIPKIMEKFKHRYHRFQDISIID